MKNEMNSEVFTHTKPRVLQHFSQEHKVVGLLSMRIRQGFKKEIELKRIKKYVDWVFEEQLIPHFEDEEKFLLSFLPDDDKIKKRTLAEHRKLKRLLDDNKDLNRSLSLFEELLDLHIRFEERVLFNHIQQTVSPEQLKKLNENHKLPLRDKAWDDCFWD
ncbi:MAG: hemerythrin domain-containing protein [Weeksellaceae bacterium]|jgi:hemerythrin-like domain-containing protein|nr:hemerythrin domain-containing protein [Weeksellaceae bacterium]